MSLPICAIEGLEKLWREVVLEFELEAWEITAGLPRGGGC